MIFMHELGHYLTARWTGMKVTEFFIGFGPRLWSFRKGETEYGVKGIPAGAYVRIIGMNNLDPVDPDDEQRSYRVKSWPRKMLVVSAGSAMHFIMAIVLLAVLAFFYGAQNDDGAWQVSRTSQASAAAELGIEPGDVMLSVGGEEVTGFLQFGDLVRPVGVNSPRSPGNATARSSPIPSSSAVVSPPRARTPSRDSLSATASSRSRAPTSSAGTTTT